MSERYPNPSKNWPQDAIETMDNLHDALAKQRAIANGLNELCVKLHGVIKETTQQMHNEGTGEYTLPAWFARDLHKAVDLIPS